MIAGRANMKPTIGFDELDDLAYFHVTEVPKPCGGFATKLLLRRLLGRFAFGELLAIARRFSTIRAQFQGQAAP